MENFLKEEMREQDSKCTVAVVFEASTPRGTPEVAGNNREHSNASAPIPTTSASSVLVHDAFNHAETMFLLEQMRQHTLRNGELPSS